MQGRATGTRSGCGRGLRIGAAFALAVGAGVCALTFPNECRAEDQRQLSKARAQFQQAVELEQAGNHAAALQAFREVGQFRMTPQVRFHIAVCEEKLGRLVAALGGFELALADAESVGAEFKAEVEGHVRRLQSAIPKLVIERGHGAEAAEIELDGVALGASSIGVPVPVDPGPHIIRGRSPTAEPFETTVRIAEREAKTVKVTLSAKDSGPRKAAQLDTGAEIRERPSRTLPYVLGGVGIASLVGAGVMFGLRQNALSDLESACGADGKSCPASSRDTYDNLQIYNYGSQIALGAGLLLLGTSITLIVLERKQDSAAALSLAPAVSKTAASANLIVRY